MSEALRSSVGVVVVSYHSATELPGCIGALAEADQVAAVVVLDNASGDGSAAIARRSIIDADHRSGASFEVLEMEQNHGFAGGCNRGLAALPESCRYVAFLNPDVRVSRRCLALCAEYLDRHEACGGVAPRLMRLDGATVDSLGQVVHPTTLEVRDLGYGRPLDEMQLLERPVLAACGAAAVMRRAALDQVAEQHGPWADHFFCFWEDLELGWRMSRSGWPIVSLPSAVATHSRGAGASSGRGPLRWRRPPELEACILTNRWMTLMRHLNVLDLLLRLPVLAAWDAAAVALGVIRRPRLAGLLARRLPLLRREWRQRRRPSAPGAVGRPRLGMLPC